MFPGWADQLLMEGNSRVSVHRSAGNSTLWYFQPEQAGYLGWQCYYLAHYLAEGHGLELMLFYLLLSDWFSLYLRVSREGSWGDARIDGLEYKQCVCRQTLHATITLGALSIIHFYSNGNAVCSCIPPRTHVHSSSQLHLLRQFSTGTLAPQPFSSGQGDGSQQHFSHFLFYCRMIVLKHFHCYTGLFSTLHVHTWYSWYTFKQLSVTLPTINISTGTLISSHRHIMVLSI